MAFKKPFRAVPVRESKAHRLRRTRQQSRRGFRSALPIVIGGFAAGIAIGGLFLFWPNDAVYADGSFRCSFPRVTDGDTIRCGSKRIRLQGIDAPEMPGHCREGRDCTPGDPLASKENLSKIIGWFPDLRCRQTDTDGYGRIVAQCAAGEVDLSCQQVADGHAVYRYASITC